MNSTAAPHRSRLSRLTAVIVMLAVLLTLLTITAEPAKAATGTYQSKGFGCETTSWGRRVMAYPPKMTSSTGQLQMVYWSPDLYRWDGYKWVLYDSTRPWNYAVANNNGVQYNSIFRGTWFTPANNSLQFVVYNNLPRGYYKIADFYRWGSTGHYAPASFVASASSWSPYVTGASYCHFS